MVALTIPGFGETVLEHLVCDFSGTLSVDGDLVPGVEERINRLSESLAVHILTADTHGKAQAALKGIKAVVHLLDGKTHSSVKADYVRQLGADRVIAFGNGNNDARMLVTARIGVAICLEEGCAVSTIKAADILVHSANGALDLLLHPKRLVATLRR
jgi:P-type E1-E2 ATPase